MNPALLSSRGESLYSLVTATVSLWCSGCEAKSKTRPGGSVCIAFKMKNWLHAQVEQLGVSRAVPGSHHVLHTDLSDLCACSGQDTLSRDTQWNWASTYCLWKRQYKNVLPLFPKNTLMLLKCSGPCCEQALTEFSVVLFVSPWIQWHKVTAMGPRERTFSSQNHSARVPSSISAPSQPGTWAPLHQQQHRPCPCPLLQTTKFLLLSGLVVHFQLAKAS